MTTGEEKLSEQRKVACTEALAALNVIATRFSTSAAGKLAQCGIVNVSLALDGKPTKNLEDFLREGMIS